MFTIEYSSRGTDLSIYARDLYDGAHLSVRRYAVVAPAVGGGKALYALAWTRCGAQRKCARLNALVAQGHQPLRMP